MVKKTNLLRTLEHDIGIQNVTSKRSRVSAKGNPGADLLSI